MAITLKNTQAGVIVEDQLNSELQSSADLDENEFYYVDLQEEKEPEDDVIDHGQNKDSKNSSLLPSQLSHRKSLNNSTSSKVASMTNRD